ncbi:MAG: tetraacyldisaccharide 4'-kinase, partial [Vicinamibacterales bacterium]
GLVTIRDLSPERPNLWKRDLTPCISVGNLAMGGRGKTPVVMHLARLLVDAGERPAVLSRGYGRRLVEPGVVVVSDGTHVQADLDRGGDEPLLIARAVAGAAVLVCEQRAIARVLAERALGATVILLDDGFQHRQVRRDVDLVIVSAEDLRDRPVPFGRLREPVRALGRADAVIVDGGANAADPALAGRHTLALRRSIGAAVPVEADRPWVPNAGPVVAVAGIAQPERFAESLTAAGWTVTRMMSFRDHHAYRPIDLAAIVAAVKETGAVGAVTTEKDAVRLRPLRPLPCPVATIPLDVSIEPAAEFREWLFDRLRAAREARA